MKLYLKNPVVLMLLCLMAGIFMPISFIETPVKFQVQGMTLPVALGLGKMMFGISTKIQDIILIVILIFMMISQEKYTKWDFMLIIALIILLSLEQFWMLPVLDTRVDLLSAGNPLPPTSIHDYFIYAETLKAILIITAVILQFKKQPVEC